ncbi:MAG: TolC family protein [Gemmatimonadaceae bacterium]|nr:TolC family protein [Gemmatimonadaceae bacterium]
MNLLLFRLRHASAFCVAIAALSGCAHLSANDGIDGVNRAVTSRTDFEASWLRDRGADSVAAAYAAQALHGVVPVDTAIRIALLRNKRLQATFEDLGIAQADVVQAGLLANPVFSGGRFVADGGGPGILQLGLALPFIDYLQRPSRRSAARQAYAAEQSRVAAAVIATVADVRVAYAEAQAAAQMEELRSTVLQATEASAVAAGALHDAGNVSDFDLAQQQAMAADARLALLTARGERVAHLAALARVMGVTSDSSWTPAPRLGLPADTLPPVQVLAPLAQARNLELHAAFESAAAAGRLAGLANTFALLPDGSIGVGRETDPDGRFTGATLTVPLPLFDQGQGRVARARATFRQAVDRHDALAVEIAADVTALAARVEAARERAVHLQRTVLPLRAKLVAESQRFVNAMEQSVFTLLLARQAEIDAGQAYVEALRDYWSLRARLEQAVGGSFQPLRPDEQATGGVRRPMQSPRTP